MNAAIIDMFGRVTIPAEVRSRLGLQAGDRIEFVRDVTTGCYEIIVANMSVTALKGIVRARIEPVSVEAMELAITSEIRASH
ncbi:AbrB/MazE/SpoVT family DNA-binding domain-containing protein [Paraburkholderia bannensis]|uniref:AbrB/MazE/SpoVT family DNA-binding domain-containing protein n=1 Tax=Paraburkholderia bannensis TaxID=765414 RepID=UPI002AAFE034|nr:AbrB/MazE/SpoVT family DNA-binding domain-containing protein [Paraburkholderia bannensis]